MNIENDMYSRVKSFYQYLSTGLHAVKELIKNALRSRKNSITIDVTYVGDMLEWDSLEFNLIVLGGGMIVLKR